MLGRRVRILRDSLSEIRDTAVMRANAKIKKSRYRQQSRQPVAAGASSEFANFSHGGYGEYGQRLDPGDPERGALGAGSEAVADKQNSGFNVIQPAGSVLTDEKTHRRQP